MISNVRDLNTYLLAERIQQTHFCEDHSPPIVYFGVVLRRHAADGGREELVKQRSSHVGTKVGICQVLDGGRCAFGIRRKDKCGVVKTSQPPRTVKDPETCFCALKLVVRELGGSVIFFEKREWIGFW